MSETILNPLCELLQIETPYLLIGVAILLVLLLLLIKR